MPFGLYPRPLTETGLRDLATELGLTIEVSRDIKTRCHIYGSRCPGCRQPFERRIPDWMIEDSVNAIGLVRRALRKAREAACACPEPHATPP